ncbi:MAG TPA: class I SAM-dependent methyltransferase [Gemmatimonadaceae bacterium]|nr:class I SAM-dependent methyltransferase [Gemmatimonadaceae bacterium]
MTTLKEYNSAEHALQYLAIADKIPHRAAGEAVLLDLVPRTARRIVDLGAGDGRLLALLRIDRPHAAGVSADLSPTMLDAARTRFADHPQVDVLEYDLDQPLPPFGAVDAIVSCFAIHHCTHERKRALYEEIFDALEPGGVFYNLEHVASVSAEMHDAFLSALGITAEQEDQSNKLLAVEPQLAWLREIGFQHVDCHWKWRELALFGGVKPA